jgi:prephenate dehydrogenase
LSPEEHDHKVGAISHLPHLIAAALVSTVGTLEEKESGYFQLAGGGFRDTTRIAASNSSLWREILLDNTKVLLPLVSSFKESLVILEQALAAQDPHSLEAFLQKSQNWRQEYAAKRGA